MSLTAGGFSLQCYLGIFIPAEGHREPGETIIETAKRELREETGAVDFTIKTAELTAKESSAVCVRLHRKTPPAGAGGMGFICTAGRQGCIPSAGCPAVPAPCTGSCGWCSPPPWQGGVRTESCSQGRSQLRAIFLGGGSRPSAEGK